MNRSLFALALLAAPAALAQTRTTADGDHYRHETHIDIEDPEEVTGEFPRPDQAIVESKVPPVFPSLVKSRATFLREMLKSAEDL
jgi:hypothetical protein